MLTQDYWNMFLETGVPEYYLMYCKAKKMEAVHVPDGSGLGASGHRLQ